MSSGKDNLYQYYYQRLKEIEQTNCNRSQAASSVGSFHESSGLNFNSNTHVANGTLSTNQFYKPNSNREQFKFQAPATVGSFHESSANGLNFNNNTHVANGTLTTNQFYQQNSNQEQQIQSENIPFTQNVVTKRSPVCNESDSSVFKKPFPVKIHNNYRSQYARRFDLIFETIRTVQDKPTLKFLLTTLENLVHTILNPPEQPMDPVQLIDYVHKLVKEEYFGKRVPKSSCGSIISEQASTLQPISEARVILQDITQRYKAQFNSAQSDYSSMSRTGFLAPNHIEANATRSTSRHFDQLNLLNDSEIARRRDEAAVRPENFVAVLPKKNDVGRKSDPKLENGYDFAASSSVLNGTASGISRRGRPLKRPVKYWNSKGNESSVESPEKSVLNESMTLRNNKVVDKKKTPTVRRTKNTPNLPAVAETEISKQSSSAKKSRGRTATSGKENMKAEKKNLSKKATPNLADAKSCKTSVAKSTASKEKTNKKKREVTNQNIEKTLKKPAPKRKSKESASDVVAKKKKIEDSINSEVEEDDIFGGISYKRPVQQNLKVALSPSAALLSAKKAAGEAQGKATPPCKAIGDMMANTSFQSTMSAAKEAPKQNEAIKRLIKKMDNGLMKAPTQMKTKTNVKTTRKEDSLLNEVINAAKNTYNVENPVCSAKLTVFPGNETESDLGETDYDDEDGDDLH